MSLRHTRQYIRRSSGRRFCVNANNPAGVRKATTIHRVRQLCMSDFVKDITSLSDFYIGLTVYAYATVLRHIADHNAPLVVITVTLRPNSPWYTDELRREKYNRRREKGTWLRTGLKVHRQAYRAQCVVVTEMGLTGVTSYFHTRATCNKNKHFASNPNHPCRSILRGFQWNAYICIHPRPIPCN